MRRSEIIIWTILLSLFIISILWLSFGVPLVFNSPDENANFWFAKSFMETGAFVMHEPLNLAWHGLIKPRSMVAIGEWLVPTTFLGGPAIFGLSGFLFHDFGILFVTPFAAVLAVLAWRSVLYTVFQDRFLANVSAFLLLIHPSFWYYSGRMMMHNVLFVSALVCACWFLVAQPFKQKQLLNLFFAGLLFALSLTIRLSEALWVLPLMAAVLYWYREQFQLTVNPALFRFGAFVVGGIVVLLPFLLLQNQLYGSPFTSGYQVRVGPSPEQFIGDEVTDQFTPDVRVDESGAPFELHPRAILRNAWRYGVYLYPWMTIPAVFGVGIVLWKLYKRELSQQKEWRFMLAISAIVGAVLLMMYGGWTFFDNPDPRAITIGNSYVRYWLPFFLLLTPFATYFFQSLEKVISKKGMLAGTVIFLLFATGLSSWRVYSGPDGFVATRNNLLSFAEQRAVILEETPENAVIITEHSDKYIFPYRGVIVPLRSNTTYAAIPSLAEKLPLYYFGITLPQADVEHLQDVIFAGYEVRFEDVVELNGQTLYRISNE